MRFIECIPFNLLSILPQSLSNLHSISIQSSFNLYSNAGDGLIFPKASHSIVGAVGSADALDKAEQELIDRMMNFDYENQLDKSVLT